MDMKRLSRNRGIQLVHSVSLSDVLRMYTETLSSPTSIALRDSMLKIRTNALKLRITTRWSSSYVTMSGDTVVDALLESSISVTGALWFSCVMCASWNMAVVIISTSNYEYYSVRIV